MCYPNWIKTSGIPDEHIFDQDYLDQYCTDHIEDCKEFIDQHNFYQGIKIFNQTLNT